MRGWEPIVIKARKKPVTIEAVGPLTHGNIAGAAYWCGGGVNRALTMISVDTLEGTMRGGHGDYVIRGVKGEYYICRGDIFEETYEVIED